MPIPESDRAVLRQSIQATILAEPANQKAIGDIYRPFLGSHQYSICQN